MTWRDASAGRAFAPCVRMIMRHIVRILGGATALGFLLVSSASAQVTAPRVNAAPVRLQVTASHMTTKPSVSMKRTTPVNNQSAQSSLAFDRAAVQREAQQQQRPPLASLATARPHVAAQRPTTVGSGFSRTSR